MNKSNQSDMSARKIEIGDDVFRTGSEDDVVVRTIGKGDVFQTVGNINVGSYIAQISEAQPKEILKIAASQISLLTSYYDSVLSQATISFRWAIAAAGIGLIFFLGAIVFLLCDKSQNVATISVISGSIIEVISGINFYLYGKTTAQLANFHERLDRTQRFLLANSICETLDGDAKQKSLSELVTVISTFETRKHPSGANQL